MDDSDIYGMLDAAYILTPYSIFHGITRAAQYQHNNIH